MNAWQFLLTHRPEVLAATREHLILVLVSMAIAAAIAVPLGMLIVGRPRLRAVALAAASVLQTIPSLALFGFLIPLPFIGGSARTPRSSLSFSTRCFLFCGTPMSA
jgi:osmoprotectant transport system permease protein